MMVPSNAAYAVSKVKEQRTKLKKKKRTIQQKERHDGLTNFAEVE